MKKDIKKYYNKNKKNVHKAGLIVLAIFALAMYSSYQGAAPQISIFSADQAVKELNDITVMWRIDVKSGTATDMAVYYDFESFEVGKRTSPSESGYSKYTNDFISKEVSVPGEFSDKIKVPLGVDRVYLRAYAYVNGKNMWTDEFEVKVIK